MVYIAAVCDRCPTVSIVDVLTYVGSLASCACGGALEALPGRTYPAGDFALFRELSGLVDTSDLSAAAAGELARRLEQAQPWNAKCQTVMGVIEAIPRASCTLRLFDAHPGRYRQALAMLAIILEGRSRMRHSAVTTPHDSEASFQASGAELIR